MNKKVREKEQEYRTYEDFLEKSYPQSSREQLEKEEDPRQYGIKMAKESLNKVKRLLS